MSTAIRRRSSVVAGSAITRAVCDRVAAGRRSALVVDARLTDRATDLVGIDTVLPVDVNAVDAMTIARLGERLRADRVGFVVALGGGTTIDAATVAAIGVSAPRALEWALQRADRSAVVVLPDAGVHGAEVVAVPTTLGTSAESNAVAVVRTSRGASLLSGEALRPRHAVLDAVHYGTLDADDVRSGCLEAFLRLAGVSTADRAHRRAHSHATALGRALIALGDGPLTDQTRLRIARCSAATQRSAALRGRAPFSPRHWYLAHEVSFVVRTTKMRATASTVAGVWQHIEEGDLRWGSSEQLAAFWREAVRDTGLPLAPSTGIEALLARWKLPLAPQPDTDALASMADRVQRRWGGGRPALPGITDVDVRDVLERARWSAPNPRPSAPLARPAPRPSTEGGR